MPHVGMLPGAGGDTQSLLPVIGLAPFLEAGCRINRPELEGLAAEVAECLRATGCLVVHDPRATSEDNDAFLSLMERYYERPDEAKAAEVRPELSYQVGATPPGQEVPRVLVDPRFAEAVAQLPPGHKATAPTGPDLKWRFMWRVGPRPPSTQFPELHAAPVVPQGFPEWASVLDSWGGKMLAAVAAAMQLAAVGLGLPQDALTSRLEGGPHLLAPTGADLARHGRLGTVFAGVHTDLNCVTIHGRSRFPGLFVWLADGRRVPVRIPEGCLLLQAGKQLEHLTGGAVRAGLHEVVATEDTLQAAAAARAAGRSTWRVSSTVFAHVASDQVLAPLGAFAQRPGACLAYPPTLAGEQVRRELEVIRLGWGSACAGGHENVSDSEPVSDAPPPRHAHRAAAAPVRASAVNA